MRRTGVRSASSSSIVGWQPMQQLPGAAGVGDGLIEQAPRSISRTIRRSFTPWHRHTNAIAE